MTKIAKVLLLNNIFLSSLTRERRNMTREEELFTEIKSLIICDYENASERILKFLRRGVAIEDILEIIKEASLTPQEASALIEKLEKLKQNLNEKTAEGVLGTQLRARSMHTNKNRPFCLSDYCDDTITSLWSVNRKRCLLIDNVVVVLEENRKRGEI